MPLVGGCAYSAAAVSEACSTTKLASEAWEASEAAFPEAEVVLESRPAPLEALAVAAALSLLGAVVLVVEERVELCLPLSSARWCPSVFQVVSDLHSADESV